MSVSTIPTIGFDPNIDASIIEAKTLKILRSNYLGIGATATALNPQTLNGGTAIFWVPELIQSEEYTWAGRNDDPDQLSTGKIEVNLDINRKATYEIETLDMSVLQSGSQIEAEIASGLAAGMIAEMDAELLALAQETLIANGATHYIINDKFSTARTQDELDTMFFDMIDTVDPMLGTVNKEVLGVNKDETRSIVKFGALARFIKAGQGGDKNETERQSGVISRINGLPIEAHPFMGKTIAAGSSFSKDRSYDLSKLEAISFHTEAFAMPFALRSMTQTIGENSGNPKFIMKYKYGKKAIRPDLVRGIFSEDPVVAPAKATKENN